MKKTILFFDRCELTDLYILISKAIGDRFNVIHVAYSKDEGTKLEREGIRDYYNYLQLFSDTIDKSKIDEKLLKTIDDDIIKYSGGAFNLNASIQSDRGYTLLSYEEALLSAQCHYQVWNTIFNENHVDLFYHEPCSLFFNHIAAILCNKQGGVFRYLVQVKSDKYLYSYLNVKGDTFTCPEIEEKYKYFSENPDKIDIERCKRFIDDYRKDYSVFFGNVVNNTVPDYKLHLFSLKEYLSLIKHQGQFDRIKQNIDYWILHQKRSKTKLLNKKEYKRKHIVFVDEIPENEKYYYYSMHLEPEAVVLYLGDGIYVNQIKLIENIAAAIPPGCYLYVKDHPHEYAYRKADDYERLCKIPNIRLINQTISGKALIANAIGVFTINGTAGMEGMILGKQVYCMGRNYYSIMSKVNYIRNIRDARDIIYSNIGKIYKDDIMLYAYVYAFLESAHEGFVNYFGGRAQINCRDQRTNAENIVKDLIEELS